MDIIDHIKRKRKEHYVYEYFSDILVKLHKILLRLKNKLKLMLFANFMFLVLYEHCIAHSFKSISQMNWVIRKEQNPLKIFNWDMPWKQEASKTYDNQTIYVIKHKQEYKGLPRPWDVGLANDPVNMVLSLFQYEKIGKCLRYHANYCAHPLFNLYLRLLESISLGWSAAIRSSLHLPM